MRSTDLLSNRILSTALGIPTLVTQPDLADQIETWLHRELPLWLPPIEACLRELETSYSHAGLIEAVSAWFLLNYTTIPLDNCSDQDKTDMGFWDGLNPDTAFLHILILITEALSLTPTGRNPRMAQVTRLLVQSVRDAAAGQMMDLQGVTGLDQYEEMIRLKAAVIYQTLFQAVCIAADAPAPIHRAFRAFGEAVGITIQIVNDIHGIWHVGVTNDFSDLRKPQFTLPTLLALKLLEKHPARRDALLSLLEIPPRERDVEQILLIIDQTTTRQSLQQMLLQYELIARRALSPTQQSTREALLDWFSRIQTLKQATSEPIPDHGLS